MATKTSRIREEEEEDNGFQLKVEDLIDPLSLSSFWGAEDLYPWQCDIMTDIWEDGSRIIGTFPNEAGKTTTVIANIGLAYMSAFPGAQVVSTAGSFRQISEQLWPVIRDKVSKYPDWKINDEKLRAPSIRGCRPSTWTIFSTDDSKKAEGYHHQQGEDEDGNNVQYPLLYIVDEAKTVDSGIFEAMYRCDPDNCLVVSSPGEEEGEFYSLVQEAKDKPEDSLWDLYEIGWHDCPHLLTGRKRAMRDDLIRRFGLKHPLIQSMIFGKFYQKGGFFIFKNTDVEVAMSGTLPQIMSRTARKAAVDLSGGGDEVVFAVRDANTVIHMDCMSEADTAVSSRWLEKKFRSFDLAPEDITLDAGGLGQPIIDELEYRGWKGLVRYNFDEKALDKTKYDTRAMQDHYQLSMMMSNNEIALPDDETLKKQMKRRKFTMPNKNGGMMSLESKKALRKREKMSPDRLDCMVMLFSSYTRLTPYSASENKRISLMEQWRKGQKPQTGGMIDPVASAMKRLNR